MTNQAVSGAYSIEIPMLVNNNGTYLPAGQRIYIGDIPTLRGKTIKHIDALSQGQSISGNTIFPLGNLTLCDTHGKEFISNLPVNDLTINVNGGNRLLIGKTLDLTKSYISPTLNFSAAGQIVVVLTFWYNNAANDDMSSYFEDAAQDIDWEEIQLIPGQSKFYFPERITLQGRYVRKLMVSLNNTSGFTNLQAPSGNSVIDSSIADNGYITLAYKNKEILTRVPMQLFYQLWFVLPIPLHNVIFDVLNSYIEFSPNTALVAKTSVLLNFGLKR